MTSSGKGVDPAFQGAGQKVGTEIWRIENFQPVPLPKSEHGKFYSGDSYIILQTTAGRGGAYLYDIHFWLGKDTTQDEAGTAAIKTVELDAALGGRAVQHREMQSFESEKFLSYFKPCIIPLEGGVASGFKEHEDQKFEAKLYVCKGKRVVRLKQVPFSRNSLNHDDVFILDTENKIYQFNGANSNIQERAKALEAIQHLKDVNHEGHCDVAVIEDGKLVAEGDSGEFWVLFGGFAPIGKKVVTEDDHIPETTQGRLYSVSDSEVKVVEGTLSKSILENNQSYLLDCGSVVYVWVGRVTLMEERKAAYSSAEEFISSQNRPKSTRLIRIIQGFEPQPFRTNFESWPMGATTANAEDGRGKVAALLKQRGDEVKGSPKGTSGASVNEDIPTLLEPGGKIEVWRINGNAKSVVPKEEIGKFYSGDCYIILYTYHSMERKEDYFLSCWVGKDSVPEDHATASRLATTMANSLKGRPVQGRIFQGREPPQLVALFQPMVVLKGGLSFGFKKLIVDKGVTDETYSADSTALFRISGASIHSNKALQVDAVATSLSSTDCFVLQAGSLVFIWHGGQSTAEQQQQALKVAEFLKAGVTPKHAKEGTEPSAFWPPIGGKQSYTSKKTTQEIVRDPHLYTFTFNKGKMQVTEVNNFSQDDLLTEDIMILDTHAEVFVWVGQSVNLQEKQKALEIGQSYVDLAANYEGLPVDVPLYKVTEGNEPSFFTSYFSWDNSKASAAGNSFQKKIKFLLAVHSMQKHESSSKSYSNQGGPTQRASALAALSSAFNPSSGTDSSVKKQENSNGDGHTQRKAALAALSSAFNPSSGTRNAPPKPATHSSGQGSQRAAAVAALSSVLTAEQRIPPEPVPPRIKTSSSSEAFDAEENPTPEEVVPPIATSSITPEVAPAPVEDNKEGNGENPNVDTDDIASKRQDEEPVKPEPTSDENGGSTTFSYDRLISKSTNPITGIDYKRRESYLSDAEFQTVFGISKEAFSNQPRWKQDMQKRKLDLF